MSGRLVIGLDGERPDLAPQPEPSPGGNGRPAEDRRLTEASAAERFAWLHGHGARFDHRRGRWLAWAGHRWVPDGDGQITRLALQFARDWQGEALAIGDPDLRGRTFKAALRLERLAALRAMLDLAASLPPLADAGDRWDADPWLLGTPAGVADLRTGTLRAGRPGDRVTMSTAVPLDPDARAPRWERFLAEVFGGDTTLVDFIHRALGYSITGDTSEQCLFLCHGTGANGKSTLTDTLRRVLGDHAWNMPFSTIEWRDRAGIPNDVAALEGRRLVIASETSDGARLNEARVKALTGCDPITARFLHREFFTFTPVAKFWLAVNHKPVVRDDSHGFWRRIRLVPFRQQFAVNPGLAGELRAESPGILAWLVRGCLAWRERGLDPPASVTDATADYAQDSDPLAGFLAECVAPAADAEVWASDLYDSYTRWAKLHGLGDRERLTATAFGRKASERFPFRRANGRKVYLGIERRGL